MRPDGLQVAPRIARPPVWALAAMVAVVAATVVAFAPLVHSDFVQIDDPLYIIENPHVAAGLTWTSVAWAFTTWHAGYWIPMTWLSYLVNVELFGVSAGAEHVANLLLHIANALLLFWLLWRTTAAAGRSVLVAALFALHPLQVESVAWITERKDVLSTLFMLLAILAYVAYVRRQSWLRYLAVVGLFALGLMAKPMIVTLPILLLLLDVWPLNRFARPAGRAGTGKHRAAVVALIREKVPLLILSVLFGIITFLAQRDVGAVTSLEVFPLASRIQQVAINYVDYLYRMVWPIGLTVIYFPSALSAGWALSAAGILACISAVVLHELRRRPYLFAGWTWFLVALLPVVGLVQAGVQSVADRFTYVPLVGLFVMLGWGAEDLLGRSRPARAVLVTGAVLLVGACSIVTRGQVAYWKDNVTLFTRATMLTLHLDEYQAHLSLASTLQEKGRIDEATAHLLEALRLRPDAAEPHDAFGLLLARQGKYDQAVSHFREAVRLTPSVGRRHALLGAALAKTGKFAEAVSELSESLRLDPSDAEARRTLNGLIERR